MKVKSISSDKLQSLLTGSQLLESGPMGEKVRLTSDNKIVKFFYRKRLFSSALIDPYATRFCRNARGLSDISVASVTCLKHYYEPSSKRHIVVYPLLPGNTLRQALKTGSKHTLLLETMARFLAELHGKGVYFRSVHFGNVIFHEDSNPALIDITDVTITRGPLSPWRRGRNFRHLLHEPQDRKMLETFGLQHFLSCYERAAALSPAALAWFHIVLKRSAPDFLVKNR